MFFEEELKKYNKKIKLFVDMDGVIAYYNMENPYNFKIKRPLYSNIEKLKKISTFSNVELYILSVCKKDSDIEDKNNWLDKYAPFFKKENRVVIPHDNYPNTLSAELKDCYLKKIIDNEYVTMLIDDDNRVLKYVKKSTPEVVLYQDSVLID